MLDYKLFREIIEVHYYSSKIVTYDLSLDNANALVTESLYINPRS